MHHRPDPVDLLHFAKIVETSDDAIVSKDLDGTIRSWNRAAERMFGYTAEEAIGRSIRMIIPDELQSEEDTVLARIRAGTSVDHFETRRLRKDGSELLISLTVSPILNDHGIVIGASKIARDISDRARLEAQVREDAFITEQLAHVGATIAASLDQNAIVQKVIDIATKLTKAQLGLFVHYVSDAPSGKPQTFHALAGSAKEIFKKAQPPRETGHLSLIFSGTGIVHAADVTGDRQFLKSPFYSAVAQQLLPIRSYLAVPVRAADGHMLGGLFFAHALPDVFSLQHERLVVGIAAWASLALENSRLYVTAREADRLKDEFLAVLSHELRTPLNAIVGYARLLRGGILGGEKADRGLETLERNANALTQIVEDVLDVSRIVSGKIRLDVQPIELPLVIHNAVATVQPAADAKGVRVETIIDPRVSSVSGDPDRLQQVIWNLLANAVKFTPRDGRVQIKVEQDNDQVEIAVSDTGSGIPPAFVAHVFERFRQAEAGTTRKTGGLGLGLSIVRHLVEMHGGSVEAESEGEGQGATFRVMLPLAVAQPEGLIDNRQETTMERWSPLTTLSGLDGVRVVAIDDEEDALSLLRIVLESAGATVTTFAGGGAALEALAAVNPHVLVVDLGMPSMDGFEFIARVRGSLDLRLRDLPAAALTAFARSEDRTRALRSGFEMHLAKPVDPGELVASVATLMKRARSAAGLK